jgi:hypothetical protein
MNSIIGRWLSSFCHGKGLIKVLPHLYYARVALARSITQSSTAASLRAHYSINKAGRKNSIYSKLDASNSEEN